MKKKFSRIMVKLSGEVFGSDDKIVDFGNVSRIAKEIAAVSRQGMKIAMVIGGGNIWRYRDFKDSGLARVKSDTLGMVATVWNSVFLQNALMKLGVSAKVYSAIPIPQLAEIYHQEQAFEDMNSGSVVIVSGGTGNPFFTTDSAAALRALELEAEVLLKATKVDFVYDRDPMRYKNALPFKRLSFEEMLQKNLQVMDSAAVSLCRDGGLPIIVFNIDKKDILLKVLSNENVGTFIYHKS